MSQETVATAGLPVFDTFSRTLELAELARRLGFEAAGIIQSMYIFKPPRIGGEVVCHQDSTYIYPANNWLQRGPGLPLRGFAD